MQCPVRVPEAEVRVIAETDRAMDRAIETAVGPVRFHPERGHEERVIERRVFDREPSRVDRAAIVMRESALSHAASLAVAVPSKS